MVAAPFTARVAAAAPRRAGLGWPSGESVIDFAHPDAGTFDTPVVGHGGSEESHFVRLVAFLRTGLVVSVQANADDFGEVEYVVDQLREAAQPSS